MSRRSEKLASLIRTVLAAEIDTLHDPRIAQLTSLTSVELSPDFSVATVYVTVMGEEVRGRLCLKALQHAAGHLQSALARQVTMRQCPRLHFILDESLKHEFEVLQLIDREMAALDAKSACLAQDGQSAADDQESY